MLTRLPWVSTFCFLAAENLSFSIQEGKKLQKAVSPLIFLSSGCPNAFLGTWAELFSATFNNCFFHGLHIGFPFAWAAGTFQNFDTPFFVYQENSSIITGHLHRNFCNTRSPMRVVDKWQTCKLPIFQFCGFAVGVRVLYQI